MRASIRIVDCLALLPGTATPICGAFRGRIPANSIPERTGRTCSSASYRKLAAALLCRAHPLRGRIPEAGPLLRPTRCYSHSIVAGGLPEMSYTTRLMPRTSLMMRLETLPSNACGNGAQCAVMKSCVCTARSATTHS